MIYADNAATTRISDNAYNQMLPFLRGQYGNASSQYSLGAKSRRAIEQSRTMIAGAIGVEPSEIVFTSGGTESNTWVLRGIADLYNNETVHIITSSIEHPSVLNTCRNLEQCGVEVTYLPVDYRGRVRISDVESAIKPNTKLVSIMMANNEIGTIQPIQEVGQLAKSKNILFHTDAVQAVGHIPVDVKTLQVDFLTASAHKFNGAKGTGFLYIRSELNLPKLIFGGEQENNYRAGTENVAGIVAAGVAIAENLANMNDTGNRLRDMANRTIKEIEANIPSVRINSNSRYQLPGIVNLGFDGISGESLMHMLDLKGICVSTSSACNAGKDEPSHVLLALRQTEEQAKSAIRISYGKYNADGDENVVVKEICKAYEKIQSKRIHDPYNIFDENAETIKKTGTRVKGKYEPLMYFLKTCGKDEITIPIKKIDEIVVGGLPTWVFNPERKPWSTSNNAVGSLSASWINAGYIITQYDNDSVTFKKSQTTVTSNIYSNQSYREYEPDVIDDIPERCVIIKITQQSIDRFDNTEVDAVYEATRWTWKMSLARAQQAEYVLSVQYGIVIGVFSDLLWSAEPLYKGRVKFDGKRAPEEIANKYVGKKIPAEFRKKGLASPCLYVNC